MKTSIYQKPELTVVSFKAERGFAGSVGNREEMTFSISNLVSGSGDISTANDFNEVSSSSWSSGWSN